MRLDLPVDPVVVAFGERADLAGSHEQVLEPLEPLGLSGDRRPDRIGQLVGFGPQALPPPGGRDRRAPEPAPELGEVRGGLLDPGRFATSSLVWPGGRARRGTHRAAPQGRPLEIEERAGSRHAARRRRRPPVSAAAATSRRTRSTAKRSSPPWMGRGASPGGASGGSRRRSRRAAMMRPMIATKWIFQAPSRARPPSRLDEPRPGGVDDGVDRA
jgi:hypothetical protein